MRCVTSLSHSFVRYCIIGAGNTVLDFSLYSLLTRGFFFFREHYLMANICSIAVVVTWSFFWNKRWSFKEQSKQHSLQYTKFVAVTLGGIAITQFVLYIGVEVFTVQDLIAKVIAGPLVLLWNFTLYRLWAFRSYAEQ